MSASVSVSVSASAQATTSSMTSISNATTTVPVTSSVATTVTTATSTALFPFYPFWWYPPYAVFVGAPAYANTITLAGPPAVTVNSVTVAKSTPQTIANIYYNGTVIQISFTGKAPVEITLTSSSKPVVIYADQTQLVYATSTVGLTPASNAWVYVPSTGVVSVFADPSTLTILYNVPSQIQTLSTSSAASNAAMSTNSTVFTAPAAMNSTMSNSTAAPAGQSPPGSGMPTATMAAIGIGLVIVIVAALGLLLNRRKQSKPAT